MIAWHDFFWSCLNNATEVAEHPYLTSTCWFDQVDVHMFEGASLLEQCILAWGCASHMCYILHSSPNPSKICFNIPLWMVLVLFLSEELRGRCTLLCEPRIFWARQAHSAQLANSQQHHGGKRTGSGCGGGWNSTAIVGHLLVAHQNKIPGWFGDEGGSNAWNWGGRLLWLGGKWS